MASETIAQVHGFEPDLGPSLGHGVWTHNGPHISSHIRAESAWIRNLGPGPEVQCAQMITEIPVNHATIPLWVIVFRFSQSQRPETSGFFTFYLNPTMDQGLAYAQQLSRQDLFTLYVYGDEGTCMRSLSLQNVLRTFATNVPTYLAPYQPWTQETFTKACASLESFAPTPRALWEWILAEAAKKGAR